ncbi:hypothetical protein [Kaarinaea lacus]
MRVSFKSTLYISLLGATLGLAACSSGGDGGGGGFTAPNISTQPVAITSANESQIAEAAFDGSQGGLGLGASAQGIIPGAVIVDGSTTSNDFNLFRTVRSLVDSAIDKQLSQTGAASVTGIQASGNDSCAYQDPVTMQMIGSGSESWQASIADFNQTTGEPNSFSNGDYVTVTFNNCDYGDGEVQNGTMSITFNSNVSLAAINADIFSMDITMSFTNLRTTSATFGTETLHGTIDLSLSVNGTSASFDMSGNSFYAVSAAESVHLINFSFVAATNGSTSTVDASFTLGSTTLNGQITVVSHLEASGNALPATGYMNISGNNSQLDITINNDGTTVNVTLTINGAVQAGYPKDIPWSDLGIEVNNAF